MSFIHHVRLGPRLLGAFALVIALLVTILAYSLNRMSGQNADMDRVVRTEVGSLLILMRLQLEAQAIGVVLRDSILSDKGDVIKAALSAVDKMAAETGSMTQAAGGSASVALASHLEGIKTTQARFLAAVSKVATAMKSGDNDAARAELISDDVRSARKAYVDALAVAVEAQRAVTEGARTASSTRFDRSQQVLLALAALSLALATTVAVAIARSVVRPAQMAVAAARRIATGDLTQDLPTQTRDEMDQILSAMQGMQVALRQVVGSVRANAESVSTASAQIAAGNLDLSQRTELQASSLQGAASSMKQLGSTVRQSADNARQANQLALGASSVASEGGKVVGQVVGTMKGINDSSRKIADIIGVIDGIAFQTNILALNAAVEAARAGEQGRGFAVVASEVRSLAVRSAEAAKEIKVLIAASVERVEQGSALVNQAGVTMEEIVSSIRRVTDIMGEISSASDEQSAGVEQIGQAVGQMDQATQQNAALVEQSAAAAESLNTQARQLVGSVAIFQLSAA